MKKRVHIFYSGRVHGVGFRFTAESMARQLRICGWVKNLNDGRVEIVAEAEVEPLEKFLEQLRDYFSRYIKDSRIDWEDATGEFKDFGVNF